MDTSIARARCLSKGVLFASYLFCTHGLVSYELMLMQHVLYIFASTVLDCVRWFTEELKSRDYWQMLHHLATWHLLWICFQGGPFVELVTVELLGAVDATDMAFYAFKSVERTPASEWLRTVLQAVFVVVWFLRRVLIFGSGDWGHSLVQAGLHYGKEGDYLSLLAFGIPVGLLLVVNWVWTWEIVLVARKTILGK